MRSKWHVSLLLKNKTLIVLAHSARTIAQAAEQAGYKVIAIDGFNDLETQAACLISYRVPLRKWRFDFPVLIQTLDQLYRHYPQAEIVFGAGVEYAITLFENYPQWNLCGFSSASIQLLRDPQHFFIELRKLSIPYPEVCFEITDSVTQKGGRWLLKNAQGSGGCQIQFATEKALLLLASSPSSTFNKGQYLQRYIEGNAISVLALAELDKVSIIGFNQQHHQAGTDDLPFIYLGLEANSALPQKDSDLITEYLLKLANKFELIGLFSLDMMLSSEGLKVLELNPRIPASFEHYQQLSPEFSFIEAHLQACRGATVPSLPKIIGRLVNRVLFAPFTGLLTADMEWPEWALDSPIPGSIFQTGEPICSVYAKDHSESSNEQSQMLVALLESRAQFILQQLKRID